MKRRPIEQVNIQPRQTIIGIKRTMHDNPCGRFCSACGIEVNVAKGVKACVCSPCTEKITRRVIADRTKESAK